MDVLRQLTRKFRAQDLSDRSHSSTTGLQMKEDALDSGTASDDDDEMVHILPKSSAGEEDTLEEDEDDLTQVSHTQNLNRNCWKQSSTYADCSPVSMNKSLSSSSSLLSGYSQCTDRLPVDDDLPYNGRHSVTSSDYERCSLDFEASSSSELESHSSEEELASINRDKKRKRSQTNDERSMYSDDDDEVHELFRDQNELLFRSLSARLANQCDESSTSENVPGVLRGQSPRKRHRRECFQSPDMHRPSLDFYKMQKTCIVRRHHTLSRPRIVKLWIVNGSQRSLKTTFDPSPFCFRSLSRTSVKDSSNQTL